MTKLWQRLLMQQQSAPAAAAGYRYWGILVTARNSDSYTSIAGISLRAVPGGSSLHTLSTPCYASSRYSEYWDIKNTLDGNVASRWANAFSLEPPHEFAYDLLNPVSLAEVAFLATSSANRLPRDFTIRGSNDSLTGPWTDVKSYTGYNGGSGWHVFSTS